MEILEKWEMSGLLDLAVNKESLAQALEMSAVSMLKLNDTIDKEKLTAIASFTFPIVSLALRQQEFNITNDSSTIKKVVRVPYGPDGKYINDQTNWDVIMCKEVSRTLIETFDENMNLQSINITPEDHSFLLELYCS